MLATPLAGPIRERMLRESAGLSADGALPGNANPTLLGRLAEETTGCNRTFTQADRRRGGARHGDSGRTHARRLGAGAGRAVAEGQ